MRRVSPAWLAATLAAALLGAGCGAKDAGPAVQCFSYEDCGPDEICFYGACREAGYTISLVWAELTPPGPSGLLRQQITSPFDLSSGGDLDLRLQATLPLTGTVRDLAAGTLQARRVESIPGRPLSYEAPLDVAGFTLPLTAGAYDLRLAPADTRLPTAVFPGQSVAAPQAPLELSYPTALRVLTGRVVWEALAATGVSGAQVQAFSASGEASSIDASSEDGSYRIAFVPGADSAPLALRLSPGPANPWVPTVEQVVAQVPLDGVLPDLMIGAASTSLVSRGVVYGASGAPVAGAQVVFTASIGNGVYRALAFTGAEQPGQTPGLVTAGLLVPGDYAITIVPPLLGPDAATTIFTAVPVNGHSWELTLPPRVRLSGHVLCAAGRPVAAAEVIATRWSLSGALDPSYLRAWQTRTAADGTYSLLLDPGDYELLVIPSLASGEARLRKLVRIEVDQAVNLQLYPAAFAYGAVRSASGGSLAGVTVELYSLELAPGDEPLLVGRGQSDANGEFFIPVPNPSRPPG